ncbi:MAG: hypothetical protein M3250_06930 [Thermoproteota archaeon]|nr:hypothetical protein [Thermoproteota archaeon]
MINSATLALFLLVQDGKSNINQKFFSVTKSISNNAFWRLFPLTFLATIIFMPSINVQSVLANTYDSIWWFGESQSTSQGNIQIIYSYPDSVLADEPFNVGVTLHYIKDKSAVANWITFSNISLDLVPYSSSNNYTTYSAVNSTMDNASAFKRPGEEYSHMFSLTAPKSGSYLIFLSMIIYYGPGAGALRIFNWNSQDWYDQTETGDVEGAITSSELTPIRADQNETQKQPNLVVRLQEPFGRINEIKVEVYNEKMKNSSDVQNGMANFTLPYNSVYTVRIPKELILVPGKVSAIFLNWSDGQGFPVNDESHEVVQRSVNLDNNLELYALYKTRYYLLVNTTDDKSNIKNGTDWYDSGEQGKFSTSPLTDFAWTKKFGHWEGDITDQITQPSGSLTMDGPKTIRAVYDTDLTYITTIVAAIAGVAAIVIALVEKKEYIFSKIRNYIFSKILKRRCKQRKSKDRKTDGFPCYS